MHYWEFVPTPREAPASLSGPLAYWARCAWCGMLRTRHCPECRLRHYVLEGHPALGLRIVPDGVRACRGEAIVAICNFLGWVSQQELDRETRRFQLVIMEIETWG